MKYKPDDLETFIHRVPDKVSCCPYGRPGHQLWVRERGWERPERTRKMMREGADTWPKYAYDADGWNDQDHTDFKEWGFKRRPSIHMPRWASRITLEVTGVRVERLNDIREKDAIAEGIAYDDSIPFNGPWFASQGDSQGYGWPKDAYQALWESINGAGSWASNPWVWVIEFKRVAND